MRPPFRAVLLPLLVSFLLFGCADADVETQTEALPEVGEGTELTEGAGPGVDATIALLANGLTQAPMDAALANIRAWRETLAGARSAAVEPVVVGLTDLEDQLGAGQIDPARLGRTLQQLGEATTEAAVVAEAERDGLVRLGSLLSAAGNRLAGDDATPTADLGATLGALEGGLMNADLNESVALVNAWSERLRGAGLTDIANQLDQLEIALSAPTVDGSRVGEILEALGASTLEAAEAADPGVQAQLQRLGRLLATAGEQLDG